MLPWAYQKVREQNSGENIYWYRGMSRKALMQWRYCTLSFALALCFVSHGIFLILRILFSYYINPNSKLTYILPVLFDFCAVDPSRSCLRKPLKVCYKSHCSDLPLFISFLWLQWLDFKIWYLKLNFNLPPNFQSPVSKQIIGESKLVFGQRRLVFLVVTIQIKYKLKTVNEATAVISQYLLSSR